MSDIIRQDNSNSVKMFDEFRNALFPYLSKNKSNESADLVGIMEKEVEKGSIAFSPLDLKPVRKAAETYSMPDDFRSKIRESAENRRKRRS